MKPKNKPKNPKITYENVSKTESTMSQRGKSPEEMHQFLSSGDSDDFLYDFNEIH